MPTQMSNTGSHEEYPEIFRNLVECSPDVTIIVDADSTIRYVSPSAERMLGYQADGLLGTRLADYLHPSASLPGVQGSRPFQDELESGSAERLEFTMRHADGSWRCLEAVGADLRPGPEPEIGEKAYYVRDVTRRKAAEKELLHRAFHDHLTGLANRALFMDRLEHTLILSTRRDTPVTVLFVDLDDFKAVNDDFGHGVGDLLLKMVGQRLRACLRPGDTVARLGGDEFAVLLEDAARAGSAANVANRIAEALQEPISWSGHTLFVTASVGLASSGPTLGDAEELLHAADTAMYRAKKSGKARHEIFEEGMPEETRWHPKLENDLKRAFERGEFRVYYQPEIDLESGEIFGMEALLRWEHPSRGLIPPLEFISLIEENGLIVPIGRRVLQEACREALSWQQGHPDTKFSVSVNLSARQLQPGLIDTVAGILAETGLPAETLILEITESLLVEDNERVLETLRGLKDIDVQIAIDDFGTGYSAFSYLERFPVDYLKIDQSFVRKLNNGAQSPTSLMPLLVDLTQNLGIKAVAEGVETATQLEKLREMGCDMVQGYYFSEPLPGRAVSELLNTSSSSDS